MAKSARIRRLIGMGLVLGSLASLVLAEGAPGAPLAKTTRQKPNEFGIQDYTVAVIHASAFTADGYSITDYGSLTRYFRFDTGGHFFHGVEIPPGAVIDYIGLECAATGAGELTATLFYVDRYSGATSGIVALPNSVHGLATDYNSYELGWELTQNAHNALVVTANLESQNNFASTMLGWVECAGERILQRRADEPSLLPVRRGAEGVGDHGRLSGQPAALLPGRTARAGPDGRLPREGARAALAELRSP